MAECCHAHAHNHAEHEPAHGTVVTDPVCGMKGDTRTARHHHELGGSPYYFCSARCLEKFKADPDRYLNPAEHDPAVPSTYSDREPREVHPSPRASAHR